MIEHDAKLCPYCQGTGTDASGEDACPECDGTGYIELVRHNPEKAKKKE